MCMIAVCNHVKVKTSSPLKPQVDRQATRAPATVYLYTEKNKERKTKKEREKLLTYMFINIVAHLCICNRIYIDRDAKHSGTVHQVKHHNTCMLSCISPATLLQCYLAYICAACTIRLPPHSYKCQMGAYGLGGYGLGGSSDLQAETRFGGRVLTCRHSLAARVGAHKKGGS